MNTARYKSFVKYSLINLRKFFLAKIPGLISLYYRHLWTAKPGSLAEVLHHFSLQMEKEVFFIQVGSNDGFQHDPLCKFIKRDKWQGLLFEPQDRAFKTLCYIYQKDAVTPINKAIDRTVSSKKLYKIAFTDARWASGLSSFDKVQLTQKVADGSIDKKCLKEGITPPSQQSDYIDHATIVCTTFESAFETQQVKKVDLLHIDTEGYDFEILKLFDFDSYLPTMVIFEKTHLSPEVYQAAKEYLTGYGYEMDERAADAIGIRG